MTKKKTHSSLCNPVMFSTVMQDEELFRGLLTRILPERKIQKLRLHDCEDEMQFFTSEVRLHTRANSSTLHVMLKQSGSKYF